MERTGILSASGHRTEVAPPARARGGMHTSVLRPFMTVINCLQISGINENFVFCPTNKNT